MTKAVSAEAADANLFAVRMKAEAHCQMHMRELMHHAREAVARIRGIGESYDTDGMPPEVEAVLREQERRAAVYRERFVIFAVRGAVLSGRIPETREAEARARCADDDGLMAFLDEMSRVPVGFIDRPNTALVRH